MLSKYKINSLAVPNQVRHLRKTTAVFGKLPDFHLLTTKF